MVTDKHDAKLDKSQRKTVQRLDDSPECFSKFSSSKIQKTSVTKNPEFTPENSEFIEPSRSILIDKSQYEITEPENILTLPSYYLHNTIVSTAFLFRKKTM